jgi:hypothetical protein
LPRGRGGSTDKAISAQHSSTKAELEELLTFQNEKSHDSKISVDVDDLMVLNRFADWDFLWYANS